MRVNENGIYRDATPEEIAEFERQQSEMPEPEMTTEERLTVLERAGLERDAALIELAAMLGGA